jgi:hypothetical protein
VLDIEAFIGHLGSNLGAFRFVGDATVLNALPHGFANCFKEGEIEGKPRGLSIFKSRDFESKSRDFESREFKSAAI